MNGCFNMYPVASAMRAACATVSTVAGCSEDRFLRRVPNSLAFLCAQQFKELGEVVGLERLEDRNSGSLRSLIRMIRFGQKKRSRDRCARASKGRATSYEFLRG